jgi:hypothetical protein
VIDRLSVPRQAFKRENARARGTLGRQFGCSDGGVAIPRSVPSDDPVVLSSLIIYSL